MQSAQMGFVHLVIRTEGDSMSFGDRGGIFEGQISDLGHFLELQESVAEVEWRERLLENRGRTPKARKLGQTLRRS